MSIIIFIYLFYIILNLLTLKYPIFSFFEIENSPLFLLKLIPPNLFWILRLISLSLTIIFTLIIMKFYKNQKKILFFVLTTPWVFILAREFNPLPLIFLLLITIFYFSQKSKQIVLKLLFLFLLFLFTININNKIIANYYDKINFLKNYLSFSSLFFQGEINSAYLRIPKFSYFLHFSLPLFIFGFLKLKNYKNFLLLFILSIIFYFISPQNQFIFIGIGFLFIIQLIIINGSINIQNKKIVLILIIFTLLNFSFFLEMYFRHYQKKFGHEREYGRINLVSYIKNFPDKNIFVTKDDKIKKLVAIYSFHYPMPKIKFIDENQWNKILNKCNQSKIICVLDEKIINNLKLNKDNPEFYPILNSNGIKEFFLLTKKN